MAKVLGQRKIFWSGVWRRNVKQFYEPEARRLDFDGFVVTSCSLLSV